MTKAAYCTLQQYMWSIQMQHIRCYGSKAQTKLSVLYLRLQLGIYLALPKNAEYI